VASLSSGPFIAVTKLTLNERTTVNAEKKAVMPTAAELAKMVWNTFMIHDTKAKETKKKFRRDGKTPFGVHPILLAMLILNEETLPEEFRIRGAKALLAHDFLEDTWTRLPEWATDDLQVAQLVQELTFSDGVDKFEKMWNRSADALILILFDTTMNMTCRGNTRPERLAVYKEHMPRLIKYVEERYPHLEILKMAKAFLAALP